MKAYLQAARDLFPYTRNLRRDFHKYPELGFQEHRTSEVVARELGKLEGIDVQRGVAGTGVVGVMKGAKPGKIVLLRFDMDALPVQENTGVDYISENPGVMHACGHDGHLAIGLTAAKLLHDQRNQFSGTVKFVFQPAEEGLGGAQKMIEEGVLLNPVPDINLALHLWNEKPLGWFGITDGPLMAASDTFEIRITGLGGHGAKPDEAVDPITAGAQIVSAVQTLAARELNPLESAVISIATFQAGTAHNVIPGEAVLTGTIRTFTPQIRSQILKRLNELVPGIAEAMRCKADISVSDTSPAVVNSPVIAEVVRKVVRELFADHDLDSQYRTMVSEDMSLMMQEIPSCYCLVGSANPDLNLTGKHHQPIFNFDEQAMIYGASLLCGAVDALLGG